MKKIYLVFSLVMFSLIGPSRFCNAGPMNQLISTRSESIHVHTDKDVYFAGDRIFFKAYHFRYDAGRRSDASQVTYISLTDESGQPVANLELFSRDGNFHQNILLPGTLKTGNYKIDAWTSRMLAEGTAPFSKQIVIINRFDADINLFIAGNKQGTDEAMYSVNPENLQSFQEANGKTYLLPQNNMESSPVIISSTGDNQIALIFNDPANEGKERTIMVLRGGIAIWERSFLLTDSSQIQMIDGEMFKGGGPVLMILDEYDQEVASIGLININEEFPVKIKTDKQVYNTRERVTLSFETTPFTVRSASLTATRKENLLDNSPDISTTFFVNHTGRESSSYQEFFILGSTGLYPGSSLLTGLTENPPNPELNVIPESQGPVISGKVTGINGDPLENAVVFLSVTDFIANLQYTSTKDDGSFSFLLNEYYQDRDLYLTLFNAEDFDEPYRISLREKFSPAPFIPRKVVFDNRINEYIEETLFIKRVQQAYNSDQRDLIYSNPMKPFHPGHYVYRIPTRTITPGDYIPFDNFPEIAFEIIPGLRFRGDDNDPDPVLLCSRTGDLLPVKKSFFMNGVYVPELKNILNLTSEDISTIELLSMTWSFGSIEFPGIISIINKENLHELPDYSGYTVIRGNPDRLDVRFNPAIHSANDNNPNVPDFRETLYWEPSVRLNRGVPSDVIFFTSDLPGEYLIVVEGISNSGRPFSRQVSIEVR